MPLSGPLPRPLARIAVGAGLLTASLSKRLGRGEGSVIGGRLTLAINPNSLQDLSSDRTAVLVSGTNGKTTTTSLLATALQTKGPVVTNTAGANMFAGMVSALATSDAQQAVLEVDEGHLPAALEKTEAAMVLLLNLSRDQLDRIGEVRMQAQKWREAFESTRATIVANADDPLVVYAAIGAPKVVWVSGGSNWKLDAASCPQCGSTIVWEEELDGSDRSQSSWSCRGCELSSPQTTETSAVLPESMVLPGEVNRRNALMALTAAVILGADPAAAAAAVSKTPGPGGRFASVSIQGAAVRLILAKNPAGWDEALRITKQDDSPLVIAINARVQDGRDPSWLWDVPFEQLKGRYVVATGERGSDLAVRLLYAEVEHQFVRDEAASVLHAARRHEGHEIDVIGNYSAFQRFRRLAAS